MTEVGEVIKTEDNNAVVRIARSSACGNCGMCGMTEAQKHIDITLPNRLSAEVGNKVKLEINEEASTRVTLIIYLIPLFIAVVAMVLVGLLDVPDWVLVIVFVVGLALGFGVVWLIDKKLAHKMDIIPTMIEIINEENNND